MTDPPAGDTGAPAAGTAPREPAERSSTSDRRPTAGHDGAAPPAPDQALRSELEMAERRAAFLAEASSILVATSLDFGATLKALARLAVSRLADWCAIHSMDRSGALRRAIVSHSDPRIEQQLTRLLDTALNDRWQQTLRTVANTGRSQLVRHLTPADWFDADRVEGGNDVLSSLATGSAIVAPLTGRGDVLGTITFVLTQQDREFSDSEVAMAEELGRRAAIALDNARLYRQADEANRAKADFLAVMSHELRTPLNAIMGYTDLLDAGVSGELNEKQRHQMDRIRASARHLLQLIEEILSFARMETGAEEVRLELITADEIAREAAGEIAPLVKSRGLKFELDIVDSDVTLRTDPAKTRQILMNLLSNAVKFTEKGGVTLRLRKGDGCAHFDVLDTGIGIPQDQMDRVFDPFWQIEQPNTRRAGGTGLGLSVSRRYVRLLGGDMRMESDVGRGTRITVSLPLRLDDNRDHPDSADASRIG